jgi:hypothetical protein
MKKTIIVIFISILVSIPGMWGNAKAAEWVTDLMFSSGYRVDDLDWNIAGDAAGNNPNVMSELTWNDLEIFQVQAAGKAILNNTYYLRASVGYGWILAGDNQDSDYLGDNRTLEYSRSNNNADNGRVVDASAGIGYQFNVAAGRFMLAPLIGYAFSEQNLTITDGVQTLSQPPQTQPIGPIENLDSSYDTQWYGPWVGLDMMVRMGKKLNFFAGLEYHWSTYEAEGNWNLRPDFAHPKSFAHEADGRGILISGGGEYIFSAPWALGLEVIYQDWSTDSGIDQTFFADGSTTVTRLNEVNWNSFAVMLKVTYRFASGNVMKE